MKNKDKLIAVVDRIAKKENKSPEQVVSELNNMSAAEIENKLYNMKYFKDGGKLDYLLCLKKGGSTIKDCGCGGDVEKKAEGGETKTMIKPQEASGKLMATIKSNARPDLRTIINGIQHQAFRLPDGSIRQFAYGDGYKSTLDITPTGDSTAVYTNNVGLSKS